MVSAVIHQCNAAYYFCKWYWIIKDKRASSDYFYFLCNDNLVWLFNCWCGRCWLSTPGAENRGLQKQSESPHKDVECTIFVFSKIPPPFFTVHCPKSNPNFRYKTWNVEENEIWNILRTVVQVQYHVFPATFHVISRKMYYLWDSVCLASALYICTLYCTYEYVDKSQTYTIASSPVIGVFLCGVSDFWHSVTRRKNVGFLPGITF